MSLECGSPSRGDRLADPSRLLPNDGLVEPNETFQSSQLKCVGMQSTGLYSVAHLLYSYDVCKPRESMNHPQCGQWVAH